MRELVEQRPFLVVLLTILIVVKFLLQPLFEWQEQKQQEIAMLSNKLTKYRAIDQAEASLNDTADMTVKRLNSIQTLFYPSQDTTLFQLEQQKIIEKELEANNIVVNSFNWELPFNIPSSEVVKLMAIINIEAKAEGNLKWLLDREKSAPTFFVDEFNLRLLTKSNSEILPAIAGEYKLTFYMQGSGVLNSGN
ncbi:hypothetical protein [Pseudoalteromonas xiamenensis]